VVFCTAVPEVASLSCGVCGRRACWGVPEVTLTRAQLPRLAGAIGFGGVLGPILLMVGLSHTGAAAASLLLSLEGAATALMA
jgi:drug/metabolite transporter (DMT)-like permease